MTLIPQSVIPGTQIRFRGVTDPRTYVGVPEPADWDGGEPATPGGGDLDGGTADSPGWGGTDGGLL